MNLASGAGGGIPFRRAITAGMGRNNQAWSTESLNIIQNACGSELARDSGGSACLDAGCNGAIASKLAPTVGYVLKILRCQKPWRQKRSQGGV
ncbi:MULTISPECIES: hypothetical protein [Pseudomonas]|uniref:hypothetical protein n=1 Tax=Pseudomonas TaxID=286 RepID=UPI0013649FD4|nr:MULTISPECIES: hypothetical protein [Pseudomonas]